MTETWIGRRPAGRATGAIGTGQRGRRGGRPAALVLLAVVTAAAGTLLTGCKDMQGTGSSSASADSETQGRAVSPLDNPDGTKPGLAALTSDAEKGKARALIEKVATKGRGPKTGYDRDEFGYAWMDSAPGGVAYAHNGCDTRNDLLKRDGEELRFRSGSDCVVTSMTLHDPYTGKSIDWAKSRATTVQIDHVMPLSYDWQMGASRWPKDRREDIANDPLNLIPADGRTNSAKGDSGPASWLPPDRRIRCSYSVRFAQVSLKYDLPVTAADKHMMLAQCGG